MTIRRRLTLLFLGLVAVLLLAVMGVVYLAQAKYVRTEFQQRLRERAEVAAYVFLEQDELHEAAFETFRRRYLQALPGEVLQIYDARLRARFIQQDQRVRISDRLLARILLERQVYFEVLGRPAVGVFYEDNQGQFVVVAAAENQAGAARLAHLAAALAAIFVASLLVIYAAGYVFAGRALAPMAAVNDQVDRITAQDLHLRVEEGPRTGGPDELSRLARTFNRMLERLEEGFEAQRTFVSNASHELRTPLTAAIGELQVLLARDRDPAVYRAGLASVLPELQQLKELINNLLELSQPGPGAGAAPALTDEIRLDELLWDVCQAVDPAQRRRVRQHLTGALPADAGQLEIRGQRQLLGRALTNLLDNALKYSDAAQPVDVHFAYQAGRCHLRIQDYGIGIGARALPQVFQPFFRADNARGVSGHGVGLPLARRIIELHGGELRISSVLGEGTVVEVVLGVLG